MGYRQYCTPNTCFSVCLAFDVCGWAVCAPCAPHWIDASGVLLGALASESLSPLPSPLQSTVVGSLGEFDDLEQCRKQLRVLGREDQVN